MRLGQIALHHAGHGEGLLRENGFSVRKTGMGRLRVPAPATYSARGTIAPCVPRQRHHSSMELHGKKTRPPLSPSWHCGQDSEESILPINGNIISKRG